METSSCVIHKMSSNCWQINFRKSHKVWWNKYILKKIMNVESYTCSVSTLCPPPSPTPLRQNSVNGKKSWRCYLKLINITLGMPLDSWLTWIIAAFSEWQLNCLYLLRHSWQHAFFKPVELVKTAPGTHLTETYKDTSHRLETRWTLH